MYEMNSSPNESNIVPQLKHESTIDLLKQDPLMHRQGMFAQPHVDFQSTASSGYINYKLCACRGHN